MRRTRRQQALVFRALADPTRRAILDILRGGQRPVSDIARAFPVSRPAVSKHLRLLRQATLVRERRAGRNRYYRLNPEPLADVDRWLDPYREFWQTRLERLKAYVESQHDEPTSRERRRPERRPRRTR